MRSPLALAFFLACVGLCLAADAGTELPGRQLLQAPASCEWSNSLDMCLLSEDAATDIIDQIPESVMRTSVEQILECNYIPTSAECATKEGCRWDENMGWCAYKTNQADQDHFENCVGDSFIFLEIGSAFNICRTAGDDVELCGTAAGCGWDVESSACYFDAWKFLTGIEAEGLRLPFPKGLDALMEARANEIGEQIVADGTVKGADLLKWDPPAFQCPDGVDLALCQLAALADRAAITGHYCKSLSSSSECAAAQLCTDTCEASPSVMELAMRQQTNAYLALVADPTAAMVLRRNVECLLEDEAVCQEDVDCVWDASAGACEASFPYIMRTLARYPLNIQNPECQNVEPVFLSGCIGHKEVACQAEDLCVWNNRNGFCVPTPPALVNGLLEAISADEALRSTAADSALSCSRIVQKEDCA